MHHHATYIQQQVGYFYSAPLQFDDDVGGRVVSPGVQDGGGGFACQTDDFEKRNYPQFAGRQFMKVCFYLPSPPMKELLNAMKKGSGRCPEPV